MMFSRLNKPAMPEPQQALKGRDTPIKLDPDSHYVNGHSMKEPFPEGMEKVLFGMGCFWGAEKKFWDVPGVYVTAVGYAAGYTPNPTYEEVCTGMTGHNEVVLVVFDREVCDFNKLLKIFWESHDPTQGMRQGNDTGTQYRSGIYCYSASLEQIAQRTLEIFQEQLNSGNYPGITTEILSDQEFFYAELYHQQYLAKNPAGYCGLGGTGVCYPE